MTVTVSDVKTDLGSTQLSDSEINGYITEAQTWYDNVIPDGTTVPSDVKDLVYQKLAAHLIKSAPERQSKSTETAGVEYTGDYGMGLMQTSVGQTAAEIDPTGQLAEQAGGGDTGGTEFLLTTSSDS